MKKFVITGGPSIGKTTVIEILASRGYATVPEAARMIAEEEKIKNTDFLPWKNLAKFQELVFQRQIELEARAHGETVFIDRGVVDGVGYCRFGKVPVPEGIYAVGKNRYDKVFLLEPLGIYEEDGIRSRKFEDAEKLHTYVIDAYKEFGYQLTSVPVLPPEERVDFILAGI